MWNPMRLAPTVACLLTAWSCRTYASPLDTLSSNQDLDTRSSKVTVETAQFFPHHHSKRVKIRYGPFIVGPMSVDNGMKDFFKEGIKMPCTDCLITWMQAGLEYPNGTTANANTNLWLHHTVVTNMQRNSTVCPDGYGDDFFASGNERTPIDICLNGTEKVGYYLAKGDNLALLVELMNMEEYSQEGVLTMTFEYIPSAPAGFEKVTSLWLDIGGCTGSSDQPAKKKAFSYTSPSWKSDFTGRVIFAGAHLHDGGTHLNIKKNSTVECNCVAAYGQSPAYINGGMSTSTMSGMSMKVKPREPMTMSMDMSSMTTKSDSTKTSMAMATSTGMSMVDTIHISSISTCSNFAEVNVDDEWTITAHYNPAKHDLMTNNDGSLAPIMGIAIAFVVKK